MLNMQVIIKKTEKIQRAFRKKKNNVGKEEKKAPNKVIIDK
jgi:hypothetical protein